MFDELIQPIQIHIGEELAVEIADRQALAGLATQQRLVGRHPLQLAGPALDDVAQGAIVEHQQLGQPACIRVGDMRGQQAPQDRLVDAHEIIADVELQIPSRPLPVGGHLADQPLQPRDRRMGALTLAAGVGIVDEHPLPIPLQMVHQHMVDHPVAEVGGEDLPELRPLGHKADRRGWPVGAGLKRLAQRQEVQLLLHLEAQGIDGVALVAAAPHPALRPAPRHPTGWEARERVSRPVSTCLPLMGGEGQAGWAHNDSIGTRRRSRPHTWGRRPPTSGPRCVGPSCGPFKLLSQPSFCLQTEATCSTVN